MKCTPRAESGLSARSDPRPPRQRGLSLPVMLTRRGGAVEPAPPRLALRYPRGSRECGKAETAGPSHDAGKQSAPPLWGGA